MEKQPTFSVIIPCYKSENTIANAIGSILDQDFKDYEIICVLDGKDESAEAVIKSFDGVICETIEHAGACAARNKGFQLSKGKYVLFSDSDVYWKAGMFRVLKEKFDKNPDADFIYGGYQWTDQPGAHVPFDFDPYLLKVTNYIDTGNPVKREWVEKVGGWDESLKRWQDWDLWLRIVEAGAKGVRIEEITRTTDAPKPGVSISGQNNYSETYRIVKDKHKISDKPICVTSIAAWDHGLRVAKLGGWDFWHSPAMLPNDYKAIYVLGCFPESIEQHVQLFMDWRTRGRREKCVYIVHWIGTDILHMRTILPFLQIRQIRLMFEKYNVINLFQSEQNAEEMREMGFKGEVLPLPVADSGLINSPKPKKFTVAVYDHGGIDEKWHKWLIMEIAKAMPHIDFVFYGNKNAVGKEKNTEWLGKVPIQKVIDKSSCLLRLTIHDGYPVAPIEFMYAGRQVITNVPDMPSTEYIDLGVVQEDRIIEIKEKVFNAIQKIKKLNGDFTDSEYNSMQKFYNKLLSPVAFNTKIMEIVENGLKKIA